METLEKIAEQVNVIKTKGIEPMPVDTLPTLPLKTLPTEASTNRESISYLTLNLGGNQSPPVDLKSNADKEKDYITYGIIAFVVLLVVILVVKSKKSK